MTPRARVMAALRRAPVDRIPVGTVTQAATLEQMAQLGIRWPDAHRDAELMAGLAEGAHTLLGFELLHVPFDQTIEAELLGAAVDYGGEARNCAIAEHPYKASDPIPAPPAFTGRAELVLQAIRILRSRLGEEAAVAGGIVGPFTLVCELLGVTTALVDALRRPAALRPWLDFAVCVGETYANLQIKAGADTVTVEDMTASLDLTSPRIYQNLILPAQQELIARIHAPVVLHICGGNTKILNLLHQTGAAALSLEAKTDIRAAVEAGECAIIGAVPTVEVLLDGGANDVIASARECLAAGVHILAPGCAVPPAAPLGNVRAMVEAVNG